MADKRKLKQKKNADEQETATKEEYAVAKYLRFNLEPKKGKLVGMEVNYFIGSKAVDLLLESKWIASKAKKESDILFTNRSSCISFIHSLLVKGIFHIANKVERRKDKDKPDKLKKKKKKEDEVKEEEEIDKKSSAESTPVVVSVRERKKGKKDKLKELSKKDTETAKEIKDEVKKDDDKDKKKKEKPVKLEMADRQVFTGGEQYCVWIYDPVPVKTFVIGLLLVIGAIALCLFPLWPPEVRIGIYYLSLVGMALIGVIIVLVILRFVIFCIVWCVTIGKHHLWIFPNLTEDVGVIDSFKPLYTHKVHDKDSNVTDQKAEKTKEDKETTKAVESISAETAEVSKKPVKAKKSTKKARAEGANNDISEPTEDTVNVEQSDKEESSGSNVSFEVVQYTEDSDEREENIVEGEQTEEVDTEDIYDTKKDN